MTKSPTPTAKQIEIQNFPNLGMLIVAPAGCGKTEALSLRVKGLIDRGSVPVHHRILVLTFSNRARDNIRERLASHLRPETMRSQIAISNFHGLAARLIRAHGNVIGIPSETGIPTSDWVTRVCRDELGLGYDDIDEVNAALREAKLSPRTDSEVLSFLNATASQFAVEVEEKRQAEGRVTYDDMLRLAELIIANEQVACLYRRHFSAIVVDEFQDLTPQQLRIVQRLGAQRTTYAGDLAQGIYSFTGADPQAVFAEISSETGPAIVLSESHRSAPAVIDMVNSLAPTVGGQTLTCADPRRWPGEGLAGTVTFADVKEEAVWLVNLCKGILSRAPKHRIGIVVRYHTRRATLDRAFAAEPGVPWFRWDQPFVDKPIANSLRAALRRAQPDAAAQTSVREYLWTLAGGARVEDPSLRESMRDAVVWAADQYIDGSSFREISDSIATLDGESVLTTAGVHLLSGHSGKGQQFDWTIVVGLEEGTIPFFKATSGEALLEEARVLSVMISRARHGVILTHVSSLFGRSKVESRFLRLFDANPTCRDQAGLTQWLQAADWPSIAEL